MSVAVGFYHDNDGAHLPVGHAFDLGIVVRQGRQSDLVDGPVKRRVHHVLLLGQPLLVRGVGTNCNTTPGPYDNVADGRSVAADAIAIASIGYRHGQIDSWQ